jgi:hypothetical protein
MRVLLIHHFETMWDTGLRLFGSSFEEMGELLLDNLGSHEYDRVILTRFEDSRLEIEHHEIGIAEHIDDVHAYSYGCEPEMFPPEDEGITWAVGGHHSGAVELPDFLHNLKRRGAHVDLCGAFDGECIEDMEIALTTLKVPFRRLDHMIVG